MNCKCGSTISGISLEDEGVASAVCVAGHRIYFFRRDNGRWESQDARRKRMRKYRVCDFCGKEYLLSDHVDGTIYLRISTRVCPECCAQRGFKRAERENEAKNDPGAKPCEICGAPIVPKSPTHVRCELCGAVAAMLRHREYARKSTAETLITNE